jgi:hypothetical protein
VADDPLLELLDEARADGAGDARERQRSLRRQAEEDASLAGMLLDLAETGSTVTLRTVTGGVHHGPVVAVGADFCVLRSDHGADVFVPMKAVATLRPHPGERHPAPSGDRSPPSELHLLDLLGTMAPDRPRIAVGTLDGEQVPGQLRAVGRDVVTLALDADRRALCYLSASSICEVAVFRSG